jgi:enamine deaminase RidA (YjgF/YER057c/UK114 family)
MGMSGPRWLRARQGGDRCRADLYCAGQTSVDEHGQPLHESEMQAQAMQALDNLETSWERQDLSSRTSRG